MNLSELLLRPGDLNAMRELGRRLDALEARAAPERSAGVWAPTLYQNGAVGATVDYATWTRLGRLAVVHALLTATGAGSAGQEIEVRGLPVGLTPRYTGNGRVIGSGTILDLLTAWYACAVHARATGFAFVGFNQNNFIGLTPSFALAAGDVVGLATVYETQ